jgi:glutathione S-transferase
VKLFYSATSPYVRKVMACAIARDIDAQIEREPTNPHQSPPALLAANPLSKVPCLVTDDGMALFDSPVICEYLDSLDGGLTMFPRGTGQRWVALRLQALGDGILDAAVGRRGEMGKPQDAARDAWMARQQMLIATSLDALEQAPPSRALDIGAIAVGCALGYLDFRFGAEPWRPGRPKLAAWYENFAAEPCMALTAPKDPVAA